MTTGDGMRDALEILAGPPEHGEHEAAVPNDSPVTIHCRLGDLRRAWAALSKQEGEGSAAAAAPLPSTAEKLWLWRDGKHRFLAFRSLFPTMPDGGDPATIGQPSGYAFYHPMTLAEAQAASRDGEQAADVAGEEEALWIGVNSLNVPDLATLHVDERDCQELIDGIVREEGDEVLVPRRCTLAIHKQEDVVAGEEQGERERSDRSEHIPSTGGRTETMEATTIARQIIARSAKGEHEPLPHYMACKLADALLSSDTGGRTDPKSSTAENSARLILDWYPAPGVKTAKRVARAYLASLGEKEK